MADYQLLKWTAESLQKELERKRDNEWHNGTDHQRLVYRVERLKMFRQYINMKRQFEPPIQFNDE